MLELVLDRFREILVDLLLLYEHYAHVMGLVFFQFVSSAKISESGLLFVFILIFIVHTLMGFEGLILLLVLFWFW